MFFFNIFFVDTPLTGPQIPHPLCTVTPSLAPSIIPFSIPHNPLISTSQHHTNHLPTPTIVGLG